MALLWASGKPVLYRRLQHESTFPESMLDQVLIALRRTRLVQRFAQEFSGGFVVYLYGLTETGRQACLDLQLDQARVE